MAALTRMPTMRIGLLMLGAEILALSLCAVIDPGFAARILSMITANHIGGRLPFITVGLENGFTPPFIISLIAFYNTTYVLLMYSLFAWFASGLKRRGIVHRLIRPLQERAERRKKALKKWSRLGIFFFVWVPLPWTGAAIGSYIAHLEGYSTRDNLSVVIPAMWVGVFSWTLWFDELYRFIERLGKGNTMVLTLSLLALPGLISLAQVLAGRRKRD